ncbi:hypothetical protein [Spirosoma panaciterrae]|uniref:hypothetical protein n=1 Tax=Spirosoma panaciterrae TaxID=496058 RepID=UPI000382E4BC|nr:hypothetical protein [Spirosoma panaciterrae]
METNTKLMALAILAASLTAPLSYAQQVAPTPPEPPVPGIALNDPQPGPDQPGRPGPGKHGRHPGDFRGQRGPGQEPQAHGLTSLTTVSGTVGQWIANDDSVLDGFTIGTGSAATTVKFPSHLGKQIQQAIKPGSSVSVTGYSDTTPRGETVFLLNSLTAGKSTVTHTPPTQPATPPEPPALTTATGKIADYRMDREGRVNGFVLDDKTIVTIPPHVAYQLTNLAKKGNTISVQGYPKSLREGQVQLEKLNILRASVLTINGQQYLVR